MQFTPFLNRVEPLNTELQLLLIQHCNTVNNTDFIKFFWICNIAFCRHVQIIIDMAYFMYTCLQMYCSYLLILSYYSLH